MKNTALLIIDMINDFNFSGGPILAKKCEMLATSILHLKQSMKTLGYPIIYINDHYQLWRSDINQLISHCTNSYSKNIIQMISPEPDDYVFIKPHYSAFYETPLNSLLGYLKIENLIITGVAGNICILFTANDAHMRNYNLYIPEDCIASNSDQDNIHALKIMQTILKANIMPSSQFKLTKPPLTF
ncbi:isochorismatase family cysteine hydrolase [Bacillus cytotoxicus]|uniref:isochorismatase family cysteine hydrolase n=1 Tax=unclassified Bacillus cereus group TaxID=2750818 RepID=UPI001F57FF1C|nr:MULTISPECIES: isochorismatase family cysteine hydrolase [unclassified Bacillus cereus group]EMA6345173.1 cysteine hydrolase [Bacillus cytotoxicus]